MKVTAVILAGGTGSRMGVTTPKQFIPIDGTPIIALTLLSFEKTHCIDQIIVVSHKDYCKEINEIISEYGISKFIRVIEGGKTRQESSFNALEACKDMAPEIVLLHDAARPFIKEEAITKAVEKAKEHGAAVVAVKTTDTIYQVDKQLQIQQILKREALYNAQTPQAFKYDLICQMHDNAKNEGKNSFSDDASLLIHYGHKVQVVEGEYSNIKITTKSDLEIAKAIVRS